MKRSYLLGPLLMILGILTIQVVSPSGFSSNKQKQSEFRATSSGVIVDNSTSTFGNEVPNLSWSHTLNGIDRLLVVGVSYYSGLGRAVTAVTYAGINLTKLASKTQVVLTTELWYIVAPPTGTDNIFVSFSVTPDWVTGGATSWTGVDQTTPFGQVVTAGGNSATPSVSVVSSTDEMVQDVLTWKVYKTGASGATNQTGQWNDPGTAIGGGSSTKVGAGNVTMSWILSLSVPWAQVGVSIKPSNDTTPPIISNVAATAITLSSANVSWTTNEAADTQVEYGLTISYGNTTALDPTLTTTHAQTLSNLTPNTLYHYRVRSKDAAGNLAVSADSTFMTLNNAGTAPNIVFIMTDDQDVGTMNVMANVQNLLAQSGVTFDNFFVSYPLCCPSRATLLTGQHAHNHGIVSNDPSTGGAYPGLDHSNTLPVWLQNAGYYTGHIGRYMNGYGIFDASSVPGVPPTEIPQGWDEWFTTIDPSSFQVYNYQVNENGTIVTYGQLPTDYHTDVIAQKALDFINNRAGNNTPFFLLIDFTTPQNINPAPRHIGAFNGLIVTPPPSFNEPDVSDKPAHIQNLPLLTSSQISTIARAYRRRREALLSIDEAVASIVDTLNSNGQLHNTVIIFTSDHGLLLGEHRLQRVKIVPYEEAIRIPFIIYAPGLFAGGQTISELAVNVDWASTIIELAGATAGLTQDGQSIMPLIQNPTTPWRTGFLAEVVTNAGAMPSFEAIRVDQYTYADYITAEMEFYDLLTDPYQETSLHDSTDPNLQQIMSDLQQKLATLKTCAGSNCWLTSAPINNSPKTDFSLARTVENHLPTEFQLMQNYPNPFNPETEIRFQLPQAKHVVIRIFNTLGQQIRTVADLEYGAGYHTLRWDGKDENGNPVPSGIYIYELQAGTFSRVMKMSLVR